MKSVPKARWGWMLGLLLVLATPAQADWPSWLEPWLFNSEERTARAMKSAEESPQQASEALDTALRLEGDDPLARYNVGTARLSQEDPQAAPFLESAANGAAQAENLDLASDANYNLGNARFAAEDLPGAIEAYKQALRQNPGFEDAKHNLELAQRKLQEQQNQQDQDQQNQDQQQDQENQDQQQDQQNQDQQDQQDQEQQQDQQDQENQDQENQDQQDQEQQQQQQNQDQQDQEQQQQNQQQQQQQNPLPQFEDLPDMTAEEAASILEAIENMEREQRRQEALEAAKTNSGKKKDW